VSGPDVHPGLGVELPPLTVRFTRETLVRYAGASTDFNPIHYSEHFATSLGLPGVVAHGMLTMGVALRVVTDWVGGDPGLVQSWSTRFAKPVFVPDGPDGTELQLTGRVSALSDPDDDGSRVATLAVEVVCADERVLRGAVAEVRLPAELMASWRWAS
jgi:acyl dehydratase